MREIHEIIIHCSATRPSMDIGVEATRGASVSMALSTKPSGFVNLNHPHCKLKARQ